MKSWINPVWERRQSVPSLGSNLREGCEEHQSGQATLSWAGSLTEDRVLYEPLPEGRRVPAPEWWDWWRHSSLRQTIVDKMHLWGSSRQYVWTHRSKSFHLLQFHSAIIWSNSSKSSNTWKASQWPDTLLTYLKTDIVPILHRASIVINYCSFLSSLIWVTIPWCF